MRPGITISRRTVLGAPAASAAAAVLRPLSPRGQASLITKPIPSTGEGALGIEALSGKQALLHGKQNLTYHLIITVEELFEMAGVVGFIYALLDYISRQFPKLDLQVSSR